MYNYLIVLFKNKKKQRVIKSFVTLERCNQVYKKYLEESNKVQFEVQFENGSEVEFDIAIIDKTSGSKSLVYKKDNMGRNIKIKMDDQDSHIILIDLFKKEEKIFDLQRNEKITLSLFINRYLKTTELKIVTFLNNKIIVQIDDKFNLFSLKNENDSLRFLETLRDKFFSEKRTDCLFVNDDSSPQRKSLIKTLSENGYSKKILYRNFTTFPQKNSQKE